MSTVLRIVFDDVNRDIALYEHVGYMRRMTPLRTGYEGGKYYEDYRIEWNKPYYVAEFGDSYVTVDRVTCVRTDIVNWGRIRCFYGKPIIKPVLMANEFLEVVKKVLLREV